MNLIEEELIRKQKNYVLDHREGTWMNNKKFRSGLLVGIIMLIMSIFIGTLISVFFKAESSRDILQMFNRYFLAILGSVLMAKWCGLDFRFKTKNLLKGIFVTGITMHAYVILDLVEKYVKLEMTVIQAIPRIVFVFVATMGVGFFEEMLCRGAFFNAFRFKYGESQRGIVKAAFISSFVFGLLHFMNLIGNPDILISTIAQVCYATMIGFSFSCIYYITDNFWVCAILHGLIDFAAYFWGCFVNPEASFVLDNTVHDESFLGNIIEVGICAVLTVVVFYQLKREFAKRGVDKEQLSNA